MDPIYNPYRPGAGVKPLTLAGRTKEIQKAVILLKRVKIGAPQRSLMLYGLRGVGKTVLLNEIQEIASNEDYIYEHLEVSENDNFKVVISQLMRKILLRISSIEKAKDKVRKALGVLKAFSLTIPDGPELRIDVDVLMGNADSGNFQNDLIDLIENLGQATIVAEKSICLFIDEVQYLKEDDFEAIIASSHRISQKNYPIIIICAGLPQIIALSGDAKSYAERLFDFIPISNLEKPNAIEAITGPAEKYGVKYENEALDEIFKITEGYPYFIQEQGKHAWDLAESSPITVDIVLKAKTEFEISLDNSFFKVRLDRATESEKRFMRSMAELGKGPYRISDLARIMEKEVKSLGPARALLIHKGFIYPPQFGYLDFSVPQFDVFLRRYYNLSSK